MFFILMTCLFIVVLSGCFGAYFERKKKDRRSDLVSTTIFGTIHLNGEFWGVIPIFVYEISNLKVPLVIIILHKS